MISLAGGLPLQWPEPVNVMFKTMATMSSAGTTLLVPDCELTHLRSADAFFMKQIFFTCTVPIIITICLSAWGCIRLTCGTKCCQLKKKDYKNYTILSIVLMTFLCYPTLVKLCLSMLKCVKVGDHRYLMADLQELCFSGQHLQYALMLSLPQFVLYILGLPILGFIIVHKNKKHLKRKDIRMRYGLLYMGYRKDREWWEIVIAIRKIAIVAIGTFGTFMGVVDLQAFIALNKAEKITIVKRAEAEADSKRLSGEGIAQQRLAIVRGFKESVEDFQQALQEVDPQEIMQFVLMTQYFDTLTSIGSNSTNNTIMVPHTPGGMKDFQQQIIDATIIGKKLAKDKEVE